MTMATITQLRISESEMAALHAAFKETDDPDLGSLLDKLCSDCDDHGDDDADDD